MQVTYVANTGFVVSAGGKKVLIDALFGHWEWDWCDVPPLDAVARMREGESPFDGVDVVLVTHAHADHFDPEIVAQYLAKNPSCILIAPRQAVGRLSVLENWNAIQGRVTAPSLEPGECIEIPANGVSVRVWRLAHGPYMEEDPATGKPRNRHEAVEHFAFGVNLGEEAFFHSGDWAWQDVREPNPLGRGAVPVDVAFLGPAAYEALYRAGLQSAAWAPKHAVLMHLLPGGRVEEEDPAMEAAFSNVARFASPMEAREIPGQAPE
jgi:L-ascorbate metabolism protein UlaG (beta-lactamase superfamily)